MVDELSDALQQSEERYRTLFEQAPVGVFLYDRSLTITACNPRFVELLRSSRERLVGLDMRTLRFKAILPPIEQALEGLPTSYEGPYVATTSAAEICISMRLSPVRDAQGGVVGGMGIVEDVTERVWAEADRQAAVAALQRSEARFRQLIEGAPDAVAVSSGAGRLVYANAAMAALLGREDGGELVGARIDTLVHPDDREAVMARTRALLDAGLPPPGTPRPSARPSPVEHRLLRRDGSFVTAEVISMVIEYDGAPALIGFARDLTDRKILQARLLQADRMVSVGTLAAGVAHEINNPLAYLIANLELVGQRKLPELARRIEAGDGPEAREALGALVRQVGELIGVARDGADRVRHIVRDLKAFSRGDDERITQIDVRRVLDASVNMAWNEIRHRARLVKEYEDVPPVSANEARLGQVFLNLLVNAAQALPVGGALENTVRVRARRDGDARVLVEIADTGEGMPPSVVERIFDPFFTTKPVGVGTGLGLWIVQGIVASLGGEIDVESAPGAGTTFRVRLPIAHGAPALKPPSGSPAPSPARRGRVLVIDDEPAIARALRSLLSDEHDVTAAHSGREALALLAEDDRYDAILCDLMMPDISGPKLFEELERRSPDLARRVVFVTGGAFSTSTREFLERVPNARLEKPFDMDRLRAVLRRRVGA